MIIVPFRLKNASAFPSPDFSVFRVGSTSDFSSPNNSETEIPKTLASFRSCSIFGSLVPFSHFGRELWEFPFFPPNLFVTIS